MVRPRNLSGWKYDDSAERSDAPPEPIEVPPEPEAPTGFSAADLIVAPGERRRGRWKGRPRKYDAEAVVRHWIECPLNSKTQCAKTHCDMKVRTFIQIVAENDGNARKVEFRRKIQTTDGKVAILLEKLASGNTSQAEIDQETRLFVEEEVVRLAGDPTTINADKIRLLLAMKETLDKRLPLEQRDSNDRPMTLEEMYDERRLLDETIQIHEEYPQLRAVLAAIPEDEEKPLPAASPAPEPQEIPAGA